MSATVAAARKSCPLVHGEALFALNAVPWSLEDRYNVDINALLIGSANALRLAGPQLDLLRDKPVHAVGKTTAELAISFGFHVEKTGEGGLQSLLDAQDCSGGERFRYLRLCGAERVPLKIPSGIEIEEQVVYQSVTIGVSPEFTHKLRSGGIIMLHSAAAARHFAAECIRLDIPTERLSLAALGPRIVAEIGGKWAQIRTANRPTEAALLALVADMCQDR